jgi:hypothetical protein
MGLEHIKKQLQICLNWSHYATYFSTYLISHERLKNTEFTVFSLKTGFHFSSLLYFFFSLNNTKKTIYASVPEMFNFNLITSTVKPQFKGTRDFF